MTQKRIADIATGLDIFARAQFWEGLAGYHPFQKIKGLRTPSSLIGLIKDLMSEVDSALVEMPDMEIWTSTLNTRLYQKILDVASAITSKYGLEAEDILAEDMSETGPSGSVFFAAGKMTSKNPSMLAKVKAGTYLPSNAFALAKQFVRKHCYDKVKQVVNRQRLEKDQAGTIVEQTVGGTDPNLSGDEWMIAIDRILGDPNHPLSREFIQFLMDAAKQMKTYLASSYLSRMFYNGSADVGEIANDFSVTPQAVRNQLDKFKEGVAGLLASNPNRGGAAVINMLSDADFLNNLLQGRVRGDKVAKKKANDGEKALRAATIRLAHQNPKLRPLLLPLLKS